MFDPAPRFVPELARNNYLFDRVEVTGSEPESRASNRDSVLPSSKTHDPAVNSTPTSNVKERLRSLQRIWTAMTKFIAS